MHLKILKAVPVKEYRLKCNNIEFENEEYVGI